jgi:hypothetical protein
VISKESIGERVTQNKALFLATNAVILNLMVSKLSLE